MHDEVCCWSQMPEKTASISMLVLVLQLEGRFYSSNEEMMIRWVQGQAPPSEQSL